MDIIIEYTPEYPLEEPLRECLRDPPPLREPLLGKLCFRRSSVFRKKVWANGKL